MSNKPSIEKISEKVIKFSAAALEALAQTTWVRLQETFKIFIHPTISSSSYPFEENKFKLNKVKKTKK
jgi:hypothetical protein